MLDQIEVGLLLIVIYLLFTDRKNKRVGRARSSVVMDTSALIDGRIVDIVRSGFLQKHIIVPKVVLNELQMLADGKNTHKRDRARVGLEMVSDLQSIQDITVTIDSYMKKSSEATDEVLIQLAAKRDALLCTTDYNLNKVAESEGVKVLNVNELANIMRAQILPGEKIEVKLIQKGEGPGQGIGYLDDGTMAVIENTTHKMRNTMITAKVDRMIQTKAGKMVFGRYENTKL